MLQVEVEDSLQQLGPTQPHWAVVRTVRPALNGLCFLGGRLGCLRHLLRHLLGNIGTCSRVWSYQGSQATTSFLAWRRVTKPWPCSRFILNDPNSVSLQALSQPLPRRLIEAVQPYSVNTSLKSWLAY